MSNSVRSTFMVAFLYLFIHTITSNFFSFQLSLADIQFMHFMTFPEQYADVKFPVDDFPDLAALITRVENQPQLKQYLNNRGK